ncbi:hypothetical protein R1sor_020091 [Riccia sorocarpa]|uniref:Reverse transcriptase domain-containing protein n=1 Tax=Riccia sorocarpa TaxID=122646 RepID=A0ABD3IG16_9MARC
MHGLRDAREIATRREGPRFTRAQTRDGKLTWSRIDRGYVAKDQVTKVIHHSQFWASDHIPLSLLITLEGEVPGEAVVIKSTYFKADHVVVEEELGCLAETWKNLKSQYVEESPLHRFVHCWAGIRNEIKRRQYKKAQRLHKMPEKEKRLQQLLKLDPNVLSQDQQQEIGELSTEIKELETWKLHSGHTQDEEEQMCTAKLLQSVHSTVTPEQRKLLEDEPTEQELHEVLLLLPQGKSPGIDGMGKEVMVFLWPILGRLYSRAMLDFWNGESLPACFKDGLLILLPKVDDLAVKELQVQAETRITVNGDLLPSFPVNRGVRHGCPLSPLLFSLASIPFISALVKENSEGWIRAVCVGGRQVGKTNVNKSKVLMIGKCDEFPSWLQDLGIQMVGGDGQTRYLGATLTTKWKGVDNGRALLAAVSKKAQNFFSPFLSFEARTIGLKHVVFSSMIYHLMSACFKKGALRKVDNVLRSYIWSKDKEGKQKKALVAWDRMVLPERWGGLGVFELQRFQMALLCKTILRAMENPTQSLWAPIFMTAFLREGVNDLFTAMTMFEPPSSIKGCPMASLLIQSWVAFSSEFRWMPQQKAADFSFISRQRLFLLARRNLGIHAATEVATNIHTVFQYLGISSLTSLCQSFQRCVLPDSITEKEETKDVLHDLMQL